MTSARFEELEKRCAKLKKARIIRIVFMIASLFLVSFGGYYWMSHNSNELSTVTAVAIPQTVPVQTPILDKNESNATILLQEEQNLSQIIEDETLFLAPHISIKNAKLPKDETQAATRLLSHEQELLKRYNTVQNFDNAYALADFYFEQKSYGEVITWAKEASKHYSRSEKPWILYAKAKFYLGDRAEAIRSLELFLSYINSKEAQELLNFYKGQE
jgi:hypothetical protein